MSLPSGDERELRIPSTPSEKADLTALLTHVLIVSTQVMNGASKLEMNRFTGEYNRVTTELNDELQRAGGLERPGRAVAICMEILQELAPVGSLPVRPFSLDTIEWAIRLFNATSYIFQSYHELAHSRQDNDLRLIIDEANKRALLYMTGDGRTQIPDEERLSFGDPDWADEDTPPVGHPSGLISKTIRASITGRTGTLTAVVADVLVSATRNGPGEHVFELEPCDHSSTIYVKAGELSVIEVLEDVDVSDDDEGSDEWLAERAKRIAL